MVKDMSAQHFDLVIIGTGSGNSIPGPEFDDKSIAIIEKGTFGGTCLNVGCIPTKMFVHAAETAIAARQAHRLGVSAEVTGIDLEQIRTRVFSNRIDPIAEGGERYRRGPETPNITVFDQPAVFVGPRTIQSGEHTITGDQIVIATGARPVIPPVVAEANVPYYTNENIMRIEQLPSSMTILGGGFIAVEFASVFAGFGVDVTIINRSERLLRSMDRDVSDAVTTATTAMTTALLGRTVSAVWEEPNDQITVELDNGQTVTSDILLVAMGRVPNGDLLGCAAAGIALHEDGHRIVVDDYGRTTAEGVWALGDASSPYQLKHVANAEMRAVRHNLLHPEDLTPMPHKHVPAGVFGHPQVATVGLSEAEAREQNLPITVKVQRYGDVAMGWAMEDTEGFVKLIARTDTGQIIGAHIVGDQATTLLQTIITFMAFGIDARRAATDQYWIHPALPEVIENALLGLELG